MANYYGAVGGGLGGLSEGLQSVIAYLLQQKEVKRQEQHRTEDTTRATAQHQADQAFTHSENEANRSIDRLAAQRQQQQYEQTHLEQRRQNETENASKFGLMLDDTAASNAVDESGDPMIRQAIVAARTKKRASAIANAQKNRVATPVEGFAGEMAVPKEFDPYRGQALAAADKQRLNALLVQRGRLRQAAQTEANNAFEEGERRANQGRFAPMTPEELNAANHRRGNAVGKPKMAEIMKNATAALDAQIMSEFGVDPDIAEMKLNPVQSTSSPSPASSGDARSRLGLSSARSKLGL